MIGFKRLLISVVETKSGSVTILFVYPVSVTQNTFY